jgi:ABC-type multidrug transport system ATPase subunit
MQISRDLRAKIFRLILESDNPFSFAQNQEEGFLPFLSEIWDLHKMPSEDSRFSDAHRDIFQHTVNNNDWDEEYLFVDRLKLLEDNDRFIKFLEVFLRPSYQQNVDLTYNYVSRLNNLLSQEAVTLITVAFENEDPLFELVENDKIDHPVDLPQNTIPFYVVPNPGQRRGFYNSVTPPISTPCFTLIHNHGWNDYGHWTEYYVHYHKDGERHDIGIIKIGTDETKDTKQVLPRQFRILDDRFCSLWQDFSSYEKLKEILGPMLASVLFALKDSSFFSEIADKFEETSVFKKSLTREDTAERVFRQARQKIRGIDLDHIYRFSYNFKPKYADEHIKIDFDFNSVAQLPSRIYAIIGKNGSGKTQLITSLPMKIAQGEDDFFIPQAPVFSKVIAVSYSTFDRFEIPRKTSEFNYVYCGLRDEQGELRSERGQLLKFHNTWKRINELNRLQIWREILLNLIEKDIIDLFIKPSRDPAIELVFDRSGFTKAKSYLSSGQSILLYVISEIIANIRLDSLLLFDEPETHLHPNAITQLMNTIVDLVYKFESYCIIATHSPLLIQELFSKNVFVLERRENIPSIRRIGIESFGENLSTLTEEVFGNRAIPKHYTQVLDDLVAKYGNYDQILRVIQEDNFPLSLNARLYLQTKLASQ